MEKKRWRPNSISCCIERPITTSRREQNYRKALGTAFQEGNVEVMTKKASKKMYIRDRSLETNTSTLEEVTTERRRQNPYQYTKTY